jgi:CRP-like cAMP-binding protein
VTSLSAPFARPASAVLHLITDRSPDGDACCCSVGSGVTEAALSEIALFAQLTPDQREQLASVCSWIDVDAGSTLIHEGDFGYSMFAIVDGTAEVTKNGERVGLLHAGDVFGEIAILSGGRRQATVTATAPMRLITVMNRDVWRLEREAPELGMALRETIAAVVSA